MQLSFPGGPDLVDGEVTVLSNTGHVVQWTATSRSEGGIEVVTNGSAAFDSYSEFVVQISPPGDQTVAVPDVRISIPLGKSACRYMMKVHARVNGC